MDYQNNLISLQFFIPEMLVAGTIVLVIIADLVGTD